MKIWIMNHYASDMFRDKAGRHYWFAKFLEKSGYEVTIFCASSFHNTGEGIQTDGHRFLIKKDGNTPFVFVYTKPSQGNGIDRVINMLQFYRGLFPATQSYAHTNGKPDVILASSVHPLTLLAGIKIAKKLKVPCVCEIRDLWPEAIFAFSRLKAKSLIGRALVAGEHWIYRKADALIFTKEGDTDYIREQKWDTAQGGDINLEKCHYINNGVNLAKYDQQVKECILSDEDLDQKNIFNVVYTGMIRPVNNIGQLLDCAALLKRQPDIRFLIYGAGSQLEELQNRARVKGLDNVRFKGFVERKYIPYILSRSSINLLNYSQSKYNWTRGNSSNKLFEYMASRKPVISTVKMGYSIIEKYQCGEELLEDSPQALADAIKRLHSLPQEDYQQMCINARNGAKDFDFTVLTEKLINVFQLLIAKTGIKVR